MLPARHNNWMPDIFNDFFDTNWMDRPKATAPAINVIETPEAYELELAGLMLGIALSVVTFVVPESACCKIRSAFNL